MLNVWFLSCFAWCFQSRCLAISGVFPDSVWEICAVWHWHIHCNPQLCCCPPHWLSSSGFWLKISVNAKWHMTRGISSKKYFCFTSDLCSLAFFTLCGYRGFKCDLTKKDDQNFSCDLLKHFLTAFLRMRLLVLVLKVPCWRCFILFKYKVNRDLHGKILLVISSHDKTLLVFMWEFLALYFWSAVISYWKCSNVVLQFVSR